MEHQEESKPSLLEKPQILRAYTLLPGEFYIVAYRGYLLRAVGGGGQTADALDTSVQVYSGLLESDVKFRLWHDTGELQPTENSRFAFQTAEGTYLTAVGGGGQTTDAFHSDATEIQAWEEFGIEWQVGPVIDQKLFNFAIRTSQGNFVTAVGGGGKSTEAIHTDATIPQGWESFVIRKAGALGSGLKYYIIPVNSSLAISAVNGGGETQNVFILGNGNLSWGVFTLVEQEDGSYSIGVPSGNFVTAIGGGGLASGTSDSDNLQTNRTTVQAWEKFRFIDRGDGTYCIQTVSGYYLKVGYYGATSLRPPFALDEGEFSTDISDINVASEFYLQLVGL